MLLVCLFLSRLIRINPFCQIGVVWSLLNDARAIDYACFEDWADDYGYDSDSRKAEKIYNDCLAIGLKLRAGLGENLMEKLRDTLLDY